MSKSPAPARKRANAYHHGDLREALIEAAYSEVERDGAEVVNMSALARRLGVSQAAPYRHFADRDDLLTAVAAKGFRAFTKALEESLGLPHPSSRLGRLAHAYVEFGLQNTGLYRLMFVTHLLQRAPPDGDLPNAASESLRLIIQEMPPSDDEASAARLGLRFVAALHGITMMVEQGFLPTKVRKISAQDLVDDLVREVES